MLQKVKFQYIYEEFNGTTVEIEERELLAIGANVYVDYDNGELSALKVKARNEEGIITDWQEIAQFYIILAKVKSQGIAALGHVVSDGLIGELIKLEEAEIA